MSVVSNDDLSNLSSEGDDDYAKLQRFDNANDTLTTTSTITENERNYSLTNVEQKNKKQRIV
jgi:hypothetical protein